jgi:aminoglycoside 3-N-acetyltransferase
MKEKSIFSYNNKKFFQQDVTDSILNLGIKNGDIIFIHSDLSKFGKLSEIKTKLEFNTVFLNACLDAVGSNGTVVIPTFTYSFGDNFNANNIFDINNSPSVLNYFTEVARLSDGFIRSDDPMLSVVSHGNKTNKIIKNLSNICLGKGSVWENLHEQNAHNLFLGFKFDTTFIHYIEEYFKVPYRHDIKFSGKIRDGNKEYKKSYTYFATNRKIHTQRNRQKLYKKLHDENLITKIKLGGADIMTVTSKDLFDVSKNLLQDNPYSLVDILN